MKEVVPGIHQLQFDLRGGFSPQSVNVYLIKGNNECLLVDTGWDTDATEDAMKKQLADIGAGLSDIKRVVATHCHSDHCGMAGRLQGEYHAKFYMHHLDFQVLKTRLEGKDSFLTQTDRLLRTYGVPDPELVEPFPPLPEFTHLAIPDVMLQGGETIPVGEFNFQVLWTPGHSPGHVSLYEPTKKLLLSGDFVLPTVASNVGLHLQYVRNPLGDYLKSLNRVKRLDVALVLPGHGDAFSGLNQRLEELIQRLKQRSATIMEAMADGKAKTAYHVSIAIPWSGTNAEGWDGLPAWDKRFAVLETVAHLESLRSKRRLDRFSQNGDSYYQTAQ